MKKGVSLIVLVVTIVTILIISGVVIVNLNSENNVISKGKEATFKENMSQFKTQLEQKLIEKEALEGINREDIIVLKKEEIKKYIPSATDKYLERMSIVRGELYYDGTAYDEILWARELEVGKDKMKKPELSDTEELKDADGNSVIYEKVVPEDGGNFAGVVATNTMDIKYMDKKFKILSEYKVGEKVSAATVNLEMNKDYIYTIYPTKKEGETELSITKIVAIDKKTGKVVHEKIIEDTLSFLPNLVAYGENIFAFYTDNNKEENLYIAKYDANLNEIDKIKFENKELLSARSIGVNSNTFNFTMRDAEKNVYLVEVDSDLKIKYNTKLKLENIAKDSGFASYALNYNNEDIYVINYMDTTSEAEDKPICRLLKVDSKGNIIKDNEIFKNYVIRKIQKSKDDKIYLIGSKKNILGKNKMVAVKLDKNMKKIWEISYLHEGETGEFTELIDYGDELYAFGHYGKNSTGICVKYIFDN